MNLAEFEYPLPRTSIAQVPSTSRDKSRLMIVHRDPPSISHCKFHEIGGYLSSGDVLVLNRAKVPPCRLRGQKITGGGVELLLLNLSVFGNDTAGERWECLVRPASRIKKGQEIHFSKSLRAVLQERGSPGRWSVEFFSERSVKDVLFEVGLPPLPPYIKRPTSGRWKYDVERYQTVFADRVGGVAAPTAGFHFTVELLEMLRSKGIRIAKLTLFPGTGSVRPVKDTAVFEDGIPSEDYEIDKECADLIEEAKRSGHRVVAVGTTTVRALESGCDPSGYLTARNGRTSLCIAPGYSFKVVDALVTNFHLPRSTHLILAAAFAGKDRLLEAYSLALGQGYRFLSYGDAMLIL